MGLYYIRWDQVGERFPGVALFVNFSWFFQSWFLLAFHGLDRCPRVSEEGTQKEKGFSEFFIIFLETRSNVIFDFFKQ